MSTRTILYTFTAANGVQEAQTVCAAVHHKFSKKQPTPVTTYCQKDDRVVVTVACTAAPHNAEMLSATRALAEQFPSLNVGMVYRHRRARSNESCFADYTRGQMLSEGYWAFSDDEEPERT